MLEPFILNEERVIALAGIFQAITLTQEIAETGQCDRVALEASVASIFRLDAQSVSAVYAGLGGLQRGLSHVVEQLGHASQHREMMQLTVAVMNLERQLRAHGDMQQAIRQGIQAVERQTDLFQLDTEQTCKRLADLYAETLSTLKSRVIVNGNPTILRQPDTLIQIRSCLLAALRSVVLWRQLGGSHLQLAFSRRRGCMLARGLLSATAMDRGI